MILSKFAFFENNSKILQCWH